jgi:hypothetical protein
VNGKAPTKKVGIGAAVSGTTALMVWVANTYFLPEPIPAEIGMSLATVITFGVQYWVTDDKRP